MYRIYNLFEARALTVIVFRCWKAADAEVSDPFPRP